MNHIFAKPYEFEEKEYKEITIDLDSLTGNDVSAVKKQFTKEGNFAAIPATDVDFCIMLAAKASKMPIEFFNEMSAKDYCAIAQGVQNFLLG